MVLMPLPEISSERLLIEVDELLRSVPAGNTLDMNHPDIVRWSGKAKAVVNAWNKGEGEMFQRHLQHFMGEFAAIDGSDRYGVLSILQQAHFDLKMRTAGPTSIPIAQGNVFEYFDEARKIIQLATTEAFFVDPYLDAEFASRYLTLVHATTSIRLLTSQSPKWLLTLVPAVKMLSAQTSHAISVRSTPSGLHDRWLFIDKRECYLSGASFKDGGKNAGTVILQVVDAVPDMLRIYEALWNSAKIEL